MDYETRYKAARERAKEMCAMPTDKATMEYIFPELKESGGDDNESIRKAIIEMVHDTKDVVCEAYNVNKENMLAWLEKQDANKEYVFRPMAGTMIENAVEQALKQGGVILAFNGFYTPVKGKTSDEILTEYDHWLEKQGETNTFKVPETSIKDAEEVTSRMQYISDDMKPIADFVMNYANWNLHKDEYNRPTLTVPLFRVLDALIQRGKPYGESVQNLEKQGEIDLEHYKDGENEKRKFVGYGFLKCKGDFLSFKEGETYWLEYVGKDNYNVRSDNLLGQTFHIKPVELYTVFRPTTWLEKQSEKDPCIGCTNDKGCVTCENGNMKETRVAPKVKALDPYKVIGWLVANIIDFEYYVRLFRKDFEL